VFVDRRWLESQLRAGKSLEQVGRETGRHGSTIAYWARKYGLRTAGADRFAARGAPDRGRLEALAAEGATLTEIARELDRSVATVRHWLRRWEIDRLDGRLNGIDPGTAPSTVELRCPRHGNTAFRLEGRGSYRCKLCRQERVSEWRRRVKRVLVEEAGGKCRLCGYDRCPGASSSITCSPSRSASPCHTRE
jgi:transposase-like protein